MCLPMQVEIGLRMQDQLNGCCFIQNNLSFVPYMLISLVAAEHCSGLCLCHFSTQCLLVHFKTFHFRLNQSIIVERITSQELISFSSLLGSGSLLGAPLVFLASRLMTLRTLSTILSAQDCYRTMFIYLYTIKLSPSLHSYIEY